MNPTVHVFGNADLPVDSLPLRILPALRDRLPEVRFELKDPNEEWDIPDEFCMIDVVLGLDEPRLFTDLDRFAAAPRFSVHDFDVIANLRLLKKIGRLRQVRIIGLPPSMDESAAVEAVAALLDAPAE